MNSQSKYDVVIGIDIGLSGGIAFFDTVSTELLSIYSMPSMKTQTKAGREKGILDLDKLRFILEIPKVHNESAVIVLENIHAFPGQGSVATATLMEQLGIIRGLAKGLGYDEYKVEPKIWQSFYGMVVPKDIKGKSASKTKTLRKAWLKDKSLEFAREYYPEWAETKLAHKTAHGLSDACLIGRWYLTSKLPQ